MLSYLDAVLLGLIQGISEFVPISSTAHLRLYGAFAQDGFDLGAAYSAVIQLGSWIALLIYFRKDIYAIICDIIKQRAAGHARKRLKKTTVSSQARSYLQSQGSHLALCICIGTLPICFAGLGLASWIRGPLRSLEIIALSLILVGVALGLSEHYSKHRKSLTELTYKSAFLIGLAQCLALIPGASRSGTTLAMGLCLNYSRLASLRFSFLLSIPAIGLAGFYQLISEFAQLKAIGLPELAIGTLVSLISSYACIAFLLRFVRDYSSSILLFALYRIILGSFVLLYFNVL